MGFDSDVNFLLSHFDESDLFPRKMMTKDKNYQFTVYDKKSLIQRCLESDFIDCRVNGYPIIDETKLVGCPPNFIFIDLDITNFTKCKSPQTMLNKILKNTLSKIESSFSRKHIQQHSHIEKYREIRRQDIVIATEVKPTVLWSGNGYHIYLPINALILDNYEEFSPQNFPSLFSSYYGKYNDYTVSELFLLFAKQFLTDGKADPQHRPKFKTCLIRIPNTYNSKCVENGWSLEESKVKLIQKWNSFRPPIQMITKGYRRWLVQEEINCRTLVNIKRIKMLPRADMNKFQIGWIENLLLIGISDGRKEALRLILGPYLTQRKNYDESVSLLEKWLDKCNTLTPLENGFNSTVRIRNALRNTKGYVSLHNLRQKNPWLYMMVQSGKTMLK